MNDRSLWPEWPLAVFTVALQAACALAIAGAALDRSAQPQHAVLARSFALAVFPTIAIGILASLAHVGRPRSAWRAATNARHSRLSQEIIACVVFGSSALIYGAASFGSTQAERGIDGIITVILGIIAVVANARVYRIAAEARIRRAWALISLAGLAMMAGVLLPVVYWR